MSSHDSCSRRASIGLIHTNLYPVNNVAHFNGRQGGDTQGETERAMMRDVHEAIFDLVELTKTYQSKNKLSQLLTSTLFKHRQDEMGAVVDRAISFMQVSGSLERFTLQQQGNSWSSGR